jgi:hypothetical protein
VAQLRGELGVYFNVSNITNISLWYSTVKSQPFHFALTIIASIQDKYGLTTHEETEYKIIIAPFLWFFF